MPNIPLEEHCTGDPPVCGHLTEGQLAAPTLWQEQCYTDIHGHASRWTHVSFLLS